MTIISTEIKRLWNKKSFLIILCVFVCFSIIMSLQYKNNVQNTYSVKIALVDMDQSDKSREFVKNLSSNPALEIIEKNKDDIDEINYLIKKSKINAGIIVPKDFFKNLPEAKMELIYSELDTTSPALIDMISQDFVNDVCENTMYNKIKKQYSALDADRAREEFTKLKEDNFFDLEVIKEPFNSLAGLKTKIRMDDINGFRSIFMYIITFNLLFVALSLQMMRNESKVLIDRMQVAMQANKKYFIFSNLILQFIFILVPSIMCILSLLLLKMKFVPFLYFLFTSIIVSLFIFELIAVLNSVLKDENIAFTINVVMIILFSLIGGAFFSIDIMPKAFINIASFSPFYIISSVFYEAIDGNFISIKTIIIYFILFLALYGTNLRRYSNRR